MANKPHGWRCVIDALLGSGALIALLTMIDSNGFDWRKDIVKALIPALVALAAWWRAHKDKSHDKDSDGK